MKPIEIIQLEEVLQQICKNFNLEQTDKFLDEIKDVMKTRKWYIYKKSH